MNIFITHYHAFINSSSVFASAGVNALLILFIILLVGFGVKLLTTLIVQLFALIIGSQAASLFCNYITYPGVVHHEFSHALLAFLTGARVDRIHLRPRGTTLGSVDFTPRGNAVHQALEMTLSAIAPVLCGIVTLALMGHLAYPHCALWWQYLLFFYLFISILLHMDLSPQDIAVAAKGLPLFLVVCYILFLFWHVDLINGVLRLLQLIFAG